jgi:putative YhbY family RNA-binding protein
MELELTSAQRRALRARAHDLNPVVMIGDAGLTTVVLNEIRTNLNSHELIKIRVFSDEHATRDRWLNEICTTLHAAPVQHIGKILLIYRPVPAEVKARKNKAAAQRKPARRAKRSYQRP